MGIDSQQFLQFVVQPTLSKLGLGSTQAELLLVATADFHSALGSTLSTAAGFGLFAISSELHNELWDSYIAFDCDLASKVRGLASQHEFTKAPDLELVTNLQYSVAIAWLIYQYRNIKLPLNPTVVDFADSWQRCFLNHAASQQDISKFETCVRKQLTRGKSLAA